MDWKELKKQARLNFEGSEELFAACWRDLLRFYSGGSDHAPSVEDVAIELDQFAGKKVNDPKSRFYVYG